MRDDPSVIALVARAADGDQAAWNELVDRYAPLVWSICNRYRLNRSDIDDVFQNTWLLLVEHIKRLREPAALPGWLATTTQRECLHHLRAAHKKHEYAGAAADQSAAAPDDSGTLIEEEILNAERNVALRAAFAQLPSRCQQLLGMLISDPPLSYSEIGAALQMKVGSIGPSRARCLERLRNCPQLAALHETLGRHNDVTRSAGEHGA
jgi:RNA polymerase sigma factor (sigma-70 family)